MPDLYGWVLERIVEREAVARNHQQPCGEWEYDWLVKEVRDLGNAGTVASVPRLGTGEFIALNDPESVLRRCAADRKLLTLHKPRGVDWDAEDREWGGNPHVCEGCGTEGICQDWVTDHANDCPVLLALAEGYGLTGEILAGLDRPEWKPTPPSGPSVLGAAAAEVWGEALRASLMATPTWPEVSDVPEPSPREKAMRILEPELRAIPLYRPEGDAERP